MKSIEFILIASVAILTVVCTYNWNKSTVIIKVLMVIAIVTSIIVCINSIRQSKKEKVLERINASFGDLKSRGTPDAVRMMIGNPRDNNGAIFKWTGTGNLDFLPNAPKITIQVEGRKIIVNAIIRDLKGDVIAAIENNTWTIFDKSYEYNDNENTLELVRKGERDVFFQIEYRDGLIRVSGFLLNEKGAGYLMFHTGEYSAHKNIGPNSHDKPFEEIKYIRRIFKYPREKYYGQTIE